MPLPAAPSLFSPQPSFLLDDPSSEHGLTATAPTISLKLLTSKLQNSSFYLPTALWALVLVHAASIVESACYCPENTSIPFANLNPKVKQ